MALSAIQQLEHAILYGDQRLTASLLNDSHELVNARFPDNINLTPLMWACRNRRESIVKVLLDHAADPTLLNQREANGEGGNTALWFTGQGAASGTTGIANLLLAAGTDVNVRCEYGQTALYIAADWCHLDLVQLLVSHGGDPSIPDQSGKTPLGMLRANLRWCQRQTSLTHDQSRFQERAPYVIAFLEPLTTEPLQ